MPSVLQKQAHANPVSTRHRLACPRAVVGTATIRQNRVLELIAGLLKDRHPPDANELRCLELIRRFHRWGRRDTCNGLRVVTVPLMGSDGKPHLTVDGQPATRRYVWELACLGCSTSSEWQLIVWGIDEESAYFHAHPSEQAAWAAFSRAPEPEVQHPR